jgi:hypothetical protein
MTDREKFEAAYRESYPNVCALFPGKFDQDDFGEYEQSAVEVAWQMWQASRRAAIEEAAKRIEPRNPPDDWTEYAKIRAESAAAIRALSAGGTHG